MRISAVKSNATALYFFISWKILATLIMVYWELCEDWGLFLGGISVKKFKNTPDKWAFSCFCKRPSNIKLLTLIAACLYNIICKTYWILTVIPSFTFTKSFWFICLTSEVDVVQGLVWMVVRMDNQ